MEPCSYQTIFLNRLNSLRGDNSVKSFAVELQETQQSVDKYVKGETKPPISFLVKVATRFGVSTDWLLGLSDNGTLPESPTISRNGIRSKITSLKNNAHSVAEKANELLTAISEMEKDL